MENKVVRLLDWCNKFKNDVKKTNTKNRIESLNLNNSLKQIEIENFKIEMQHREEKAKLEYFRKLVKIGFLNHLVFLAMCVSIALTLIGFNLFKDWNFCCYIDTGLFNLYIPDYNTGLKISIIIILTVLQIITFNTASIRTQIYKYFNRNYGAINKITTILLPISIVGNFNTLITVISFGNNVLNIIITSLMCVCLDMSIITYKNIIHDKKNQNFSRPFENEMQDNISILHMIYNLIFDYIRIKLMKPYFETRKNFKDSLKKYKGNEIDFKDNSKNLKTNDLKINNFEDNIKFEDNTEKYSLGILKNFKDKKYIEDTNTNTMLGISNQNKDNKKSIKKDSKDLNIIEKPTIDFRDSLKNLKINTKTQNLSQDSFKDNLENLDLTFEDKYAMIKNQVLSLKENEGISKKNFNKIIDKENDWKKVRRKLINDGLAYTENTSTKRTNKYKNEEIKENIVNG